MPWWFVRLPDEQQPDNMKNYNLKAALAAIMPSRGELKKRNFMHAKSKSSSETTHIIRATIGHLR
jgi:hypothetical protein